MKVSLKRRLVFNETSPWTGVEDARAIINVNLSGPHRHANATTLSAVFVTFSWQR